MNYLHGSHFNAKLRSKFSRDIRFYLVHLFLRINKYDILFSDAFGYVFIDNGSPDSYLISNEVDSYFLNISTLQDGNIGALFNDSNNSSNSNANLFLFNTSINQSGLFDNNNGTDTTAEDITELVRMALTSVLLGLMILITIIGKFMFS